MIGSLPYKTKQFFILVIKLSVVFGAFYFIYKKTVNNEVLEFSVFIDFLAKNEHFSLKNVIFLLFLTIFNWFFEILKWRNLVAVIKNITFFDALKQSTASLTASLFTPNRIGDYAAKVIYYAPPNRKRILLLNLMSNMAQMTMTLSIGLIGVILFNTNYDLPIQPLRLSRFIVIVILVGVFSFLGFKKSKAKIRGVSFVKVFEFIKSISIKVHTKNLLYSFIRYVIFSFQFYFLLTLFDVQVSYFNAMIVISSMYFISSIIPSIFIFDVVIKGSVAIYLFDLVGVNQFTVLSIVSLMWLLNFALPSIIGSFYVMKFNSTTFTN